MIRKQLRTRGLALIGAGLFALALFAGLGMGSAAPTASADGPIRVSPSAQVQVRPLTPASPINQLLGSGCPEGEILIMWDMPVYDADGLFVIGHVSVPFCIPEDLEPAG